MAKTLYGVNCARHGRESKDWAGKQVIVPKPKNKKERLGGGCPMCIAEKVKEEAEK